LTKVLQLCFYRLRIFDNQTLRIMKKRLTISLKMLFIFTALLSAISLRADVSGCTNYATAQEIFLNIPNNGSISETSEITIKAQFDIPNTVRSLELIEEPKPSNKQPVSRSIILKDGKVDVDIIIRGSDLLPFLSPFSTTSHVKVKLGVINYITVDNISGVFESNETNPNGNVASRILSIEIADDNIPQNESSAMSHMFSLETESSNTQISVSDNRVNLNDNLVLYPNPVRDNTLNLTLSKSDLGFSQIFVFNSLGSLVYQENVNGTITSNYTLQLPSLPSGVYFIKLHSSTKELVKKFNIIQ